MDKFAIQQLLKNNIEIEGLLRVIMVRESDDAYALLTDKIAEFNTRIERLFIAHQSDLADKIVTADNAEPSETPDKEVAQTPTEPDESTLQPEPEEVAQTPTEPDESTLLPEPEEVAQTPTEPDESTLLPEPEEVTQTPTEPDESTLLPEPEEVAQTPTEPDDLTLQPEVAPIENTDNDNGSVPEEPTAQTHDETLSQPLPDTPDEDTTHTDENADNQQLNDIALETTLQLEEPSTPPSDIGDEATVAEADNSPEISASTVETPSALEPLTPTEVTIDHNDIDDVLEPSSHALPPTDASEDSEITLPTPPEMEHKVTVDEMIMRKEASDISKAFTINDKFRYMREIFDNNATKFNFTLNLLSNMESLGEAYDYLLNDLELNPENENVKDFLEVISTHFNSK